MASQGVLAEVDQVVRRADVEHPTAGPFRQVDALLAGQGEAASMVVRDQTDTTTDAVLADAGFEADEIDRLRTEGVVA